MTHPEIEAANAKQHHADSRILSEAVETARRYLKSDRDEGTYAERVANDLAAAVLMLQDAYPELERKRRIVTDVFGRLEATGVPCYYGGSGPTVDKDNPRRMLVDCVDTLINEYDRVRDLYSVSVVSTAKLYRALRAVSMPDTPTTYDLTRVVDEAVRDADKLDADVQAKLDKLKILEELLESLSQYLLDRLSRGYSVTVIEPLFRLLDGGKVMTPSPKFKPNTISDGMIANPVASVSATVAAPTYETGDLVEVKLSDDTWRPAEVIAVGPKKVAAKYYAYVNLFTLAEVRPRKENPSP